MSKCTDRTLGDLLYEYELGILDEGDVDRFEAHLLECDHCRELALAHREVAELLREDNDVRELIGELGSDGVASPAPSGRPRWSSLLRPMAIAAVVILVLVLQPWKLQFEPADDVVASGPLLAVMPFSNMVDAGDSSKQAAIVTDLLATDLAQSDFLRVVSKLTVADLHEVMTSTDHDSASLDDVSLRVARTVRATWVLTGNVVQESPALALTFQVTEVATGETVLSDHMRAESGDDVFVLVDRLAARVRNDLLVPLGAENLYDPSVADVTTGSATAYRHYLEGRDYHRRMFLDDARRSWQKAVEIDSTFAMCYYHLARYFDPSFIEPAVAHSGRVGRRERLHILGLKAYLDGDTERATSLLREIVDRYPEDVLSWTMLAQIALARARLDEAIELYRKAIEIDPAYKNAYASLAYLHQYRGEPEQALAIADEYVASVPREPNPYDTRGDIRASQGLIDAAVADYREARRIKPDFDGYYTLLELGQLYNYQGKYAEARECFLEAATNGSLETRSSARTDLILIPLRRGKLSRAWSVLADGMGADRLDRASARGHGPGQKNHFVAGMIHLATGAYDSAAAELAATIEIAQAYRPADSVAYRSLYAFALAGKGDMAAAETVLEGLRRHQERIGEEPDAYLIGRGFVEFVRGDYPAAVGAFEAASSVRMEASFSYQYWRGRASLETGDHADAVDYLSRAVSDYSDQYRSLMAIWSVRAHYYLGRAYEMAGQFDRAMTQYRRFLDIWSDADPVFEAMIIDATERLTRLSNTP